MRRELYCDRMTYVDAESIHSVNHCLSALVCPGAAKKVENCDPMICAAASCPGHDNDKVTCRMNPCGQCKAEFLDKNNRKVTCKCKMEDGRQKCKKWQSNKICSGEHQQNDAESANLFTRCLYLLYTR